MAGVPRAQDWSITTGFGPVANDYYVYESLPTTTSIRVIEWPRQLVATTDLRFSLRVIDLDDPKRPDFTTLSYTWGGYEGVEEDDQEALECLYTNTVICDGALLKVTKNAHRALCEMRYRGRANLCWVDAVCINQHDQQERSSQVALMGRIYASADRTIIWLGEDDEAATVVSKLEQRQTVNIRLPGTLDQYLALELSEAVFREYKSILQFFSRPWFQRLWVIQEAILARSLLILCGRLTVNWDYLVELAEWNFPLMIREDTAVEDVLRRGFRGICQVKLIVQLRCENGPSSLSAQFRPQSPEERFIATFASLIVAFQDTLASDSRDRVFAPLALANQLHRGSQSSVLQAVDFCPNYSQNMGTTFLRTTLFILSKSPSLYILSLCRGRLDPSLPTWVPDFRTCSAQRSISSMLASHATRMLALHSCIDYNPQSQTLRLNGYAFGRVQQTTRPIREIIAADGILSLLRFAAKARNFPADAPDSSEWIPLCYLLTLGVVRPGRIIPFSISELMSTPARATMLFFNCWVALRLASAIHREVISIEDLETVLTLRSDFTQQPHQTEIKRSLNSLRSKLNERRTITSRKLADNWSKVCDTLYDLICGRWKTQVQRSEDKPPTPDRDRRWKNAVLFQCSILPVITDRVFVQIGDDFVGLAPAGTREGDQLWFLAGAAAPLVLRACQAEGYFEVVGEAYLPGFMDGEIFARHKDIKLEELYLR